MISIIFYNIFHLKIYENNIFLFFLKIIFNINTSNNSKIPKTIKFKQKHFCKIWFLSQKQTLKH